MKRNVRIVRADTGAVPQAGRTAEEQALDALRLDWGTAYLIGCDDEHGWYASRHGQVGGLIEENGPDELRAAIAADYGPRAGVQWGRGGS